MFKVKDYQDVQLYEFSMTVRLFPTSSNFTKTIFQNTINQLR